MKLKAKPDGLQSLSKKGSFFPVFDLIGYKSGKKVPVMH